MMDDPLPASWAAATPASLRGLWYARREARLLTASPAVPPLHLGPEQYDNAWRWLRTDGGRRLFEDEQRTVAGFPVSDSAWLAQIIPSVTPIAWSRTNCPVCEFAAEHGSYRWDPTHPDRMTCRGCGTVFPHPDYPENIVVGSSWDPAQAFSFVGKKNWHRPGNGPHDLIVYSSFSGNLRSRGVEFAAKLCYRSALLFFLTGERQWAEATRTIMLALAAVYPRYLVHNAWGQFADMDPEDAPFTLHQLPTPVLAPGPNPTMHTLFGVKNAHWNAGRAFFGGLEGHWIFRVAGAYDLTRAAHIDGRPLFTPYDHDAIQRNILISGLPLLIGNDDVNNKAGSGYGAVCLVGALLGWDDLVAHAAAQFTRVITDWFLPDGTTPESTGYATMMLHGIWRIPEILHRHQPDSPDLYTWTPYERVLRRLMEAVSAAGRYPLADDNRHPSLRSPILAALTAAHYPWARDIAPDGVACRDFPADGRIAQFWYGGYHPLIPLCYSPPPDESLNQHRATTATTTAPAGHEVTPAAKTVLFRSPTTGEYLRIGAPPGVFHRHRDHLNVIWGRGAQEFLSDLGYLWNTPGAEHTTRTAAHNLVVVDESDQQREKREGDVLAYHHSTDLWYARLRSRAYAPCDTYERCVVRLHDPAGGILADFFWVHGGHTYHWLMHGPTSQWPDLEPDINQSRPDKSLPFGLTNATTLSGSGPLVFPTSGDAFVHVAFPRNEHETVYLADGWGQRAARDVGATLPYLCRARQSGEDAGKPDGDTYLFATVYAIRPEPRLYGFEISLESRPDGTVSLSVQVGERVYRLHCAAPAALAPMTGQPAQPGAFRIEATSHHNGRRLEGLFNYLRWDGDRLAGYGSLGGTIHGPDVARGPADAATHGISVTIDDIDRSNDETVLRCHLDEPGASEMPSHLYCMVGDRIAPYPVLRADPDPNGYRICVQSGSLGHPIWDHCHTAYLLTSNHDGNLRPCRHTQIVPTSS